jgi:hypothetical protein
VSSRYQLAQPNVARMPPDGAIAREVEDTTPSSCPA